MPVLPRPWLRQQRVHMHMFEGKEMKTVIEMAREAGFSLYRDISAADGSFAHLEAFAELVRADEREACAKVCDDLLVPVHISLDNESLWEAATLDCADAIRARSET